MTQVQSLFIIALISLTFLSGFGWYWFNAGEQSERKKWVAKQTESGLQDVGIEKRQNEIRNKSIDFIEFDRLLRDGRFGQLKN